MFGINKVYLNGEFLPPDKATISAFDRGFLFGDGVYEVIPVYGGHPFRLPQHLARLQTSCAAIGLTQPLSDTQWAKIIHNLIDTAAEADQAIYLQVTRGVAARDHAFPKDSTPTVFAYTKPIHYPSANEIETGIGAITLDDIRWQRCDIKSVALLGNVILRQQAVAAGAAEAILVRNGIVTEGAASNIFIIKDDHIATAPKGELILPGITRDLVVMLAQDAGIDCVEREIMADELLAADELWLTSSTKEIMPIVSLDGAPVGTGSRGPMHQRVHALLQDYKQAFREGRVD